jgi:hypothetical protein
MSSTTSAVARCARQVNLRAPIDRGRTSSPIVVDSPPAPLPATTAGLCRPAPDTLRVNTPASTTPLLTLLKVVAVEGDDPQTRQLLAHIAVEQDQIEVNDRFDRDVSKDAEVGAPRS